MLWKCIFWQPFGQSPKSKGENHHLFAAEILPAIKSSASGIKAHLEGFITNLN
jgi:hypothetical protein